MAEDRNTHALQLSEELLADLELERVSLGALVLKASRLARIMEDDDAIAWLACERGGYQADTPNCAKWVTVTGRWADREKGTWWGFPAAQLESMIEADKAMLESLKLPNLSGDFVTIAIRETRQDQARIKNQISANAGIKAKIVAALHQFVARHYYELRFSEHQAELFEDARLRVDRLLSPLASGALDKVDSIYRRLAEGDPEAISQALTTCRRLIDSVADEIYPPSDNTVTLNGNEVKLTKQHVQNRLNAFVYDQMQSKSRRAKLRRTLADLYERVSAGVHDEVTTDEARYLFLNTYMYLGEILALPSDPGQVRPSG
jgi:hypothetical protein